MKNYERTAYYHETDQMGVIHHSNYVKWMEEARTFFMNEMGFGYKKMEELGIISPVVSIQLEYKKSVLFNDTVYFDIKIEEYNGVKLELEYSIINKETNEVCVSAKSKHCFISDGKIISLKKVLPECHELFEAYYKSK